VCFGPKHFDPVELAPGAELVVEFSLAPQGPGVYRGVTELYANCLGAFDRVPIEFTGTAVAGKPN